jgi:hypothetical protein
MARRATGATIGGDGTVSGIGAGGGATSFARAGKEMLSSWKEICAPPCVNARPANTMPVHAATEQIATVPETAVFHISTQGFEGGL